MMLQKYRKRLGRHRAWAMVLLISFSLLAPVLAIALSPKASAEDAYLAKSRGYTYAGSGKSQIVGDPQGNGASHTFTRSSDGTYHTKYEFGTCKELVIHIQGTNPYGDRGVMYPEDCPSGDATTKPFVEYLTVSPPHDGNWIDHSHIKIDQGQTYIDSKIDNNLSFTVAHASAKDSCQQQNKIDGFLAKKDGEDPANATAKATIHLFTTEGTPGGKCLEALFPIQMNNDAVSEHPEGPFNYYFVWQDSAQISSSDGTSIVFASGSQDVLGRFNDDGQGRAADKECRSTIDVNMSDPSLSTGTLYLRTKNDRHLDTGWPKSISDAPLNVNTGSTDPADLGCKVSGPIKIAIGNPTVNGVLASDLGANSATPGSDATGASDGSTPSLGCHIGFNLAALNPLNWLVCGIIAGLSGVVGELDSAITSQLAVGTDPSSSHPDQPSKIFCDGGVCDAYHTAWASFRNLALGLMVIAGLVIVISQALDMELLDAYTVRKTLPRLLMAALALTLSWPLMKFFVTLTNDLGFGIRHLIFAPFHAAGLNSTTINLGSAEWNATSLIAGLGALAFGSFGILTFIGTAALALLIAFVVLVLRQIAIIMLIILAPIAIVAYILPNTQKIYKFWWESFSKALLMFPLIAAFIASGQVFSLIASSGDKNDVINQMVAFFAYFAPYFMIPLTFKFAGAALGQIGGFVNDRSRGGFDRLRKARQDNTQKRIQKAGEGKLLHQDTWNPAYNALASRFNRASRGTANLKNAGMNPKRMRSRMAAARSLTRMQHSMRDLTENKDVAEALKDDDVAEGMAFGAMDDKSFREYINKRNIDNNLGLTNEQIEQKVGLARIVRQNTAPDTTRLTAWLANTRTHTGFDDKRRADGSNWTGAEQMQETLTDIVGSDDDLMLRALGQGRDFMMEKGRVEAAGMSYSEQGQLYRDVQGGRVAGGAALGSRVKRGALFGQSRGRVIGSSPRALENMIPEMQANFDQILAEGSSGELYEELAMAGAGQQVASNVSQENAQKHARYMNHEVMLKEVTDDMDAGVRQAIERAAEFKRRTTGGPVDRVTVQDLLDANSSNRELTANVYRYGSAWDADRMRGPSPGEMPDPTAGPPPAAS